MNEFDESLKKIFEEILKEFPEGTFEKFKILSKEDLWQANFGFGTWLRNVFLFDNHEIRKIFENQGIEDIDDMSSFIIEKFQEYLNSESISE